MDDKLNFERRLMDHFDSHASPEQIRAFFLNEYGKEQPMLTEAQLTEMIRRYYPAYEPPAPETRRQREALRQRALKSYLDGSMAVFSPVAYEDQLVQEKRRNQRLLSFMTSDEERRLFTEALAKTQESWYSSRRKPDGKAYGKDEIAALVNENREIVGKHWMDNVSRLIDTYEAEISKPYTDDELVDNYARLAVPIALTQEAITAMQNYGQHSTAYTAEQRETFRQKITGMMEHCVALEKRIIRMADTYYPIVNMDSLAQAPIYALDEMDKNITASSIGEQLGVIQLTGDEDADDEELEKPAFKKLETNLRNLLSVTSDASFNQANILGQDLADRYGYISLSKLSSEYYFFTEDGKALLNSDICTYLSHGGVMYSMRRDGVGDPEPVCAGLAKDNYRPVFGWDAVGVMQEPVPELPAMSRSQRIGNWFSSTFARRPSAAQKEYERKSQLRQDAINRNQQRKAAVSDAAWPRVDAMQKRVRLAQQRRLEGDRFLEDTMELLSRASMTRDDPDTRLAVARLVVSRLYDESLNSSSYKTIAGMFGMENADFSFAAAAEKLAGLDAFRQEFLDREILSNDVFMKSLRSGDIKSVADTAGTICSTRLFNYFGQNQWATKNSSSYQAKLEQERVSALYERRQQESTALLADAGELLQRIRLQPHSLQTRNVVAHLVACSIFSEGPQGKNRALFSQMFGTDKEDFSFSEAADRLSSPAFGELIDTKVLTNREYTDAFSSGDPARISAAAAKLCSGEFADAFRAQKWNTPVSKAYEKAEQQRVSASNTVMPGLLQSEATRRLQDSYMGNARLWNNIESLYGGKRDLRPEWTWAGGNSIYSIRQWREMQKNEIDVSALRPDGAAVDNRSFASLSMILSQLPEQQHGLSEMGAPISAVFEDIVSAKEPRSDIGRYVPGFIDPCRGAVAQCLRHMDEPLPGSEPAVTGREKLAKDLAQCLQTYEKDARNCAWASRSHAVLAEVACNALNFARAHGMTELLRENGLTDQMMENLDVAGAMSRTLTEGLDAAQEIVHDAEELHPENEARRGEWVHKMALCKAMQAESKRITSREAKLPEPSPSKGRNESMDAYMARCVAYEAKQAAANDALHQFSDELKSLAGGGEKMETLLDRLMPQEERDALLQKGSEEVYKTLSDSNSALIGKWQQKLNDHDAADARARMFERQCTDYREKLRQMPDTPENKAFIAAANQVLESGSEQSCRVLFGLGDDKIALLGGELSRNSEINLQDLLEHAVGVKPEAAPQQVQKSATAEVLK